MILVVGGIGAANLLKKEPQAMEPAPAAVANEVAMEKAIKTVEITGKNFAFSSAEIRVKKDEKVRIVFNNDSGFHDFVIDEFAVRTKQFTGPGTEAIEFVADKTGQFEYYCSVGKHRQMGMKGLFIVEE